MVDREPVPRQRNHSLDVALRVVVRVVEHHHIALVDLLELVGKLVNEQSVLILQPGQHARSLYPHRLVQKKDDDQRDHYGNEEVARPGAQHPGPLGKAWTGQRGTGLIPELVVLRRSHSEGLCRDWAVPHSSLDADDPSEVRSCDPRGGQLRPGWSRIAASVNQTMATLTTPPAPVTEKMAGRSLTDLQSLTTEKLNDASAGLDTKVAGAVKKALPEIALVIDTVARSLRDGGRLIYVGAGSSGRIAAPDASE